MKEVCLLHTPHPQHSTYVLAFCLLCIILQDITFIWRRIYRFASYSQLEKGGERQTKGQGWLFEILGKSTYTHIYITKTKDKSCYQQVPGCLAIFQSQSDV